MKKKLVRLTESDLHKMIENSVKRVLREVNWKDIENDESWDELEDNKKCRYNQHYYDDPHFNPKWTNRELTTGKYKMRDWVHGGDERNLEFDYPRRNKIK